MSDSQANANFDGDLATGRKPASSPAVEQMGGELPQRLLRLDNDSRLRLTVQLWQSLPESHRAALKTLVAEDAADPRNVPNEHEFVFLPPTEPRWTRLREQLFSADSSLELYSAPRRFDLATLFVVTAAFALLLGGLTALDAPPILKIAVSALAATVAIAQAAFQKVANPRGMSIVAGMLVCTVFSALLLRRLSLGSVSLPVAVSVVFYGGIVGGSIAGYVMGTLVGGIFLVADVLRSRSKPQSAPNIVETSPALSDNDEG